MRSELLVFLLGFLGVAAAAQEPLRLPAAASLFELQSPSMVLASAKTRGWGVDSFDLSTDGRRMAIGFAAAGNGQVWIDGRWISENKEVRTFLRVPRVVYLDRTKKFLTYGPSREDPHHLEFELVNHYSLKEPYQRFAVLPDGSAWVGIRVTPASNFRVVHNGRTYPTQWERSDKFKWHLLPGGRMVCEGEAYLGRNRSPAIGFDGRVMAGSGLALSPDRKHFGFFAGGAIWVDGRRRAAGRGSGLVVGQGGAFACVLEGKLDRRAPRAVMHDGRVLGLFKRPASLALSADGKRLAFQAVLDGKRSLVIDGKPVLRATSGSRGFLKLFAFTGRHWAAGEWAPYRLNSFLIDGIAPALGFVPRDVKQLEFSPDASRHFYWAQPPGKAINDPLVAVVDGKLLLTDAERTRLYEDRWLGWVGGKPLFTMRVKRTAGLVLFHGADRLAFEQSTELLAHSIDESARHYALTLSGGRVVLDGKLQPGYGYCLGYLPGGATPILFRKGKPCQILLGSRVVAEYADRSVDHAMQGLNRRPAVYGPVYSSDRKRIGFLLGSTTGLLWAAAAVEG